jgi:hypothetical protein
MAFADQTKTPPSPIDQVTVTSNPASPVVITADFKMEDGNVIKAPWFSQQIFIDNQSDEPVTIIYAHSIITDPTTGTRTERFFNAGDYNYQITCQGNGLGYTKKIEFGDLGEYPAKSTMPITLTYRDQLGPECPPVPSEQPIFYYGNLSNQMSHTAYNVELTLVGWFGTVKAPTGRFEKVFTFTTN